MTGCGASKSQSRTGELRSEVLGRERRGDKSQSCLTELRKAFERQPTQSCKGFGVCWPGEQTGKVR